jgi:signal transduction histidine kinase
MKTWKTGFNRKLHLAFGMLLVSTLGLAWYFYDSVKWYEYDVQRIALANRVLQDYLELANLTFRELNELAEDVAQGAPVERRLRAVRAQELQESISKIRLGIGEEVALERSRQEIAELETLEDIERLVDEVIRRGDQIHEALANDDPEQAKAQIAYLRQAGVAHVFDELIDRALADQREEVRQADEQAIALAHYITRALPIFVIVLVTITLVAVFFFTSSLTRSFAALQRGATAFSRGQLKHRIPELGEREFSGLGEAFNSMARDLLEHRKRLHDINVSLEAKVDERTRALQRSNSKLAELDTKRTRLLADISHEFRTPLTVIRGEAEIALRGDDKSNESYKESFQRIMEQADHTTRLVDDLLFIARADAGEPRLRIHPVPLDQVLRDVCANFGARAAGEGLEIEQRIDVNQVTVMGDSGRLRQVFAILLDNALRYSMSGGKVVVSLEASRNEAIVTVRDRGIGLTKEEAEQAFERFYRGPGAEAHARGTGLGLPVARAIVHAHQGRISLEGEPGKGATAMVVLPTKDQLRVVA